MGRCFLSAKRAEVTKPVPVDTAPVQERPSPAAMRRWTYAVTARCSELVAAETAAFDFRRARYEFRCRRHGDFLQVTTATVSEPGAQVVKTAQTIKLPTSSAIRFVEGRMPAVTGEWNKVTAAASAGARFVSLYAYLGSEMEASTQAPEDAAAGIVHVERRYLHPYRRYDYFMNRRTYADTDYKVPAIDLGSDDRIYFGAGDCPTLSVPRGLGAQVYDVINRALAAGA